MASIESFVVTKPTLTIDTLESRSSYSSDMPLKKTIFNDDRDWFFQKRLGLFVHWGIYSVNAWHEQDQNRRKIPRAEYAKLADQFNPVQFDPDAWLDLAEETGMEYICFTTKHHDGFCMWKTEQTEFHIGNTPYGEDILKQLADACHRRNFPLCLYYSVVDWKHPHYSGQGLWHDMKVPEEGDEPDWPRYRKFLMAQLEELCTRYGEIRAFWWDMNTSGIVDHEINQAIRRWQPKAVINGRGFDKGDFTTPERGRGDSNSEPYKNLTEACQSVGCHSWGYKEDEDYFTGQFLQQSIDKTLCRGGNFLLNIGPKADGTIAPEHVEILRNLGKWYQSVRESYRDTEMAPALSGNDGIFITRRDDSNSLYVHLNQPLNSNAVLLNPIHKSPQRAVLLNTSEELETVLDKLPRFCFRTDGDFIFLRLRNLPASVFENTVPVVRLDFDEPV